VEMANYVDSPLALGALRLAGLADLVDHWWGWQDPADPKERPAHVVCSSLGAWVCLNLGLPRPPLRDEELCRPADWWEFNNALPGLARRAALLVRVLLH